MAIDTYDVTYTDIRVPGQDFTHLPETSQNSLSQADISDAIEEASSEVYARLVERGKSKSDLDDHGLKLARRLIKAYATVEAMRVLGHSGDTYVDAIKAYNRAKKLFLAVLDAVDGDGASKPVLSNTSEPSDTFGTGYTQF